MRRLALVFLILVVSGYTACSWDYHLSGFMLDRYCKDEGRVGLFVYEHVHVGEEFFIPISDSKNARGYEDLLVVVDDKKMIDIELFDKDFTLNFIEKVPLNKIGPIISIETSVVRRSDNKVLGKSVSLAAYSGWFTKWLLPDGASTRVCPTGYDDKKRIHEHMKNHFDVVRATFTQKVT